MRNIIDIDFIDDQRRTLQKVFDEEFEEYKLNYESLMKERLEKEK